MKFCLSIKREGIYMIIKLAFKLHRNQFGVCHGWALRAVKPKMIGAFQHNSASHRDRLLDRHQDTTLLSVPHWLLRCCRDMALPWHAGNLAHKQGLDPQLIRVLDVSLGILPESERAWGLGEVSFSSTLGFWSIHPHSPPRFKWSCRAKNPSAASRTNSWAERYPTTAHRVPLFRAPLGLPPSRCLWMD